MFLNRRNVLLGIGVFFLFSKKSFSNQTSLNELMRKQFLGSNNAPIKIKEFFSLTCGHCSNFHIKTQFHFYWIKLMLDSGLKQYQK